ncbi:MAG: DUF4410 domain-containing protein, partial [Verrucomicrobiota bacterium]
KNLHVDRQGIELEVFQNELQKYFAEALTERISKNIISSTRIINYQDIPLEERKNAWLIIGEFTHIQQGSRSLRTMIGLIFFLSG